MAEMQGKSTDDLVPVTTLDFRQNLDEFLGRAAHGEILMISRNGVPWAAVVSHEDGKIIEQQQSEAKTSEPSSSEFGHLSRQAQRRAVKKPQEKS